MFVTLGTSLFHSVTWEPDPGMRIEIPRYDGWLTPEFRGSPDARLGDERSALIRNKLRERLNTGNARTWAQRLPADLVAGHPAPATFLRYCAELSTLLMMWSASQLDDLPAFLTSYDEIRLVFDPNSYDPAAPTLPPVVAEHLTEYLNTIAGSRIASLHRAPGLSSPEPHTLLDALNKLRLQLCGDSRPIDLVISGGYKSYGIILAPLASSRLCIVSLHERGAGLIKVNTNLSIDGESIPWIPERGV
jgi:hypothetical protein